MDHFYIDGPLREPIVPRPSPSVSGLTLLDQTFFRLLTTILYPLTVDCVGRICSECCPLSAVWCYVLSLGWPWISLGIRRCVPFLWLSCRTFLSWPLKAEAWLLEWSWFTSIYIESRIDGRRDVDLTSQTLLNPLICIGICDWRLSLPFIFSWFRPRRHSHDGDNERHEYVLSFCPRRIGQSFLSLSHWVFPSHIADLFTEWRPWSSLSTTHTNLISVNAFYQRRRSGSEFFWPWAIIYQR